MSILDTEQDKVVNLERATGVLTGTGGQDRSWSVVASGIRCLIRKPSEDYSRMMQGTGLFTDSVLYVNYGLDIREGDRISNIFDEQTGLIWKTFNGNTEVQQIFLVQTVENPAGLSDYTRCSLKRWDGLEPNG